MTEQLLNISADDAEEYSQSLAQIGEGWWRQIAWAFRQGMHEALAMSRREWAETYHGYIRMPIEERRGAVAELAAEGMNNSQIADTLGVGEATVRRDLNGDSPDDDSIEDYQPNHEVSGPDLDTDSSYDDPSEASPWSSAPELDESESEPEPDVEPHEGVKVNPDPEREPEPLTLAEPGWHPLGEHWLYCGDSTDEEFIKACQASSLAFADPPYNAGKADWDEGFTWKHDYLAEVSDIVAITPGIAALAGFLANTKMPYQWSMAAEITNGMTSGALRFGNWICVTLFSHGSIYRKAKDHVRIPVATGDDQGGSHPSRKPIRLLTHLIELFTTKGDTIVDPFLGSGTTLIAAKRTERRCIGAELDPMHCAEIIARYHSEAT